MGYFPEGMPLPAGGMDTDEWWAACAEHRLQIQRCDRCGTFRHTPRPVCAHCRSFDWHWEESAGRGHVFTYIVVPHPVHPALASAVPYNAAVVELGDCGGVLVTGNLINCANDDIEVGMPVRIAWEDAGDGVTLPRFEPA